MNIKESSERVISPHYPPIKFQFCLNGYGRTIDGQMTGTVHWVRFTLLSVKSGWQNPGGYGDGRCTGDGSIRRDLENADKIQLDSDSPST